MEPSLESPGNALVQLCADATRELVLIAPFIKVQALRRLLANVLPQVRVTCVTRWRADEVAAGVSDLEVFDVITEQRQGDLLLLPQLHAKYYRADSQCLVGSANVSTRAFGWSSSPNVELLIPESAELTRLVHFEKFIRSESRPATAEQKAIVDAAARELLTQAVPFAVPTAGGEGHGPDSPRDTQPFASTASEKFSTWLPAHRQPEDLFVAYRRAWDELTKTGRQATSGDLDVLDPPIGLTQPSFEAWIAAALMQMPMISLIDEFVIIPQRFGAVRDFIAVQANVDRDAAAPMWQTTMRWLLHFFPGRYARFVPSHSEIFGRVSRA